MNAKFAKTDSFYEHNWKKRFLMEKTLTSNVLTVTQQLPELM